MCGIVGIVDLREQRPVERDCLVRMCDTLFHRGPDANGLHLESGLGLGHRRLSIIDLAGGQQPMISADGDVVLVYNGEIYNFQMLRRVLIDAGHVFRTHCDTEVILYAWKEWGEACVERFNGMFAFALWQRSTKTLFMARDRIGIKPLYYTQLADGRLLFGSELKALLAHPNVPRELDPRAVEDYFSLGYVPDPKTILAGVHKLAPGHYLRTHRGQALQEPRAYWDISFSGQRHVTEDVACAELVERLTDSVQGQLIADVPLGAFLSGGVDSSAVVAMMARTSGKAVNTCSVAFDEARFDESQFAGEVATRYHTAHHVERVDAQAFDLVERLGSIYDEPFADSSAIPTYLVCALARQTVKVALSGDGGDENFAGYRRYRMSVREAGMRSVIPSAIRRPIFGLLGRTYPKLDWAPRFLRARSTFEALAMGNVEGYWQAVSVSTPGQRMSIFSQPFQRQLQGYRSVEVFDAHARRAPHDVLSRLQYLDFKTYLPGDILTKVDRASMANSLEVRVPLLDHGFVEWAAGLPSSLKLHRHEAKYVLKRALEPFLSDRVLYRPKMGFAVPLAAWFRGPLRQRLHNLVLGPVLFESGLFEKSAIQKLVDTHECGYRDHSAILWALLMFSEFQRHVLGDA